MQNVKEVRSHSRFRLHHLMHKHLIGWPQWPSSWAKPRSPRRANSLARIMKAVSSSLALGSSTRKSTLLDAFVGEQILPTGVVPVTTVPTVLRYGNTRTARVLVDTNWHMIRPEDFAVCFRRIEPENSKQVDGVEVFLPSTCSRWHVPCRYARDWVCFLWQHETTKDFIPQIDARYLSSAPTRNFWRGVSTHRGGCRQRG